MQSGFDISHLAREAQTRWLKPVEVFFILQNYEEHQLTHQIPQQPTSGSLYLFNKRVLKSFRKDGHKWRRRKDQRNIAEAHERLKVGNVDALNCYYAHGEENPNFQRRSYWMLDRAYEHIVLVHYRDIAEGSQNARSTSQFSRLSSSTFSPSPNSFITQQPNSSVVVGESYYLYNNQSSPSSVEINSNEVTKNHGMNQLDYKERTNEVNNSSVPDLSQALCRIEQQLSLNDNDEKEINTFYIEHDDSNVLEDMLRDYQFSNEAPNDSENLLSQSSEHWKKHHQIPGPEVDSNEAPNDSENLLSQSSEHWKKHHQIPGPEVDIWIEMLDSSKTLPNVVSGAQFGRPDSQKSELMILQELDSMIYPGYSSMPNVYGSTPDCDSSLLDQDELGIPLENSISLTVSQKQKFTIQDISPEWCYTFEGAKIIIIGYFLCDPAECTWACMFGDTEVPVEIIQQGVIRCHAPPHLQGKVTLCITSGNRESCSEVKEFEYRDNPCVTSHSNPSENEASKSSEELLLLARFVQMLLSDLLPEGDASESSVNLLGGSRSSEDPWSQIIDALLVGSSSSSKALDWLLQELLKDRLQLWVSSRLERNNCRGYCLSKKEQSIIHMVAGLGYEWALQPILNTGLNINFRDINGWTALHWAARFGREKMVAALIASGASAGAVTDPNSQDPMGKTPASIAATCGHKGLAGYLSEVALTSHLSSLTLEVSELCKGSAAVEAERTVNSVSNQSSSRYDDQVSLGHTLAAVRTAAQAAARIQSAFRTHSFRKRQQREAAVAISGASGDEYCILANDMQGLPQLTFRSNSRDYNSAALSIQKKYRGWKDRKYFLSLRQKVVKIQAHVRGYQVRKYYKVCWAVSILEKAVLRWRRKGVGLRGFRHDSESVDESVSDEDILTVFRKQKVDAALDEAVSRVLSMVESCEARQQYSRLLEKYRQAKAELGRAES